jgi:uncharacterized cupin superfamily protein
MNAKLSLRPALSIATFALAIVALAPMAYSQEDRKDVVVPHGPLSGFHWSALPEFGGSEAIIYRSPDGKRVAAAFQESGDFEFQYPFDEFLIVTSGTGTFRVKDGPTFTLKKGEVAYFRKGMEVHLTLSKDFSDVTMLTGDKPVAWR